MSSDTQAQRFRFSAVLCLVIRKERKRVGVHGAAVAAHLGVTREQYASLEHGRTEITIQQIWLVARALNVRPRTLWRIAETWAEHLQVAGWIEDKSATRVPYDLLERTIQDAMENSVVRVAGNPAIG
jgi:transcriptional regulator with XRE-family HTH domain